MKRYVISVVLMLACAGCSPADANPAFRFGDRARVTQGFYAGHDVTISAPWNACGWGVELYGCKGVVRIPQSFLSEIPESE